MARAPGRNQQTGHPEKCRYRCHQPTADIGPYTALAYWPSVARHRSFYSSVYCSLVHVSHSQAKDKCCTLNESPRWVGNRPLLLAEFTAIPLAAFDHDIQQRAQRNEYQGEQQVGKHAEAGVVARSGVPHHPCRSEPCLQGEVDHYLEIAHGTESERQRGMGPSATAADLAERSGQYSPLISP